MGAGYGIRRPTQPHCTDARCATTWHPDIVGGSGRQVRRTRRRDSRERALPDPVDPFLASYAPEVQEIARGLRALVLRVAPDAEEKVHRPWKTVAYGRTKKFCAISPHEAWVNLQFHSGASLPDPSDLLEGTGRAMRHVKVVSAKDIKDSGLAKLIREAARLAGWADPNRRGRSSRLAG